MTKKIVVGIVAVVLFVFLGLFALLVSYEYFPEYFGHYRFYTACKSLKPGMTLDRARKAMTPALEVGKTWKPTDDLHAGIMGATVQGAAETAAEHDSRILFIPDAKNIADWCIVYPENGKVVRVDFSPD